MIRRSRTILAKVGLALIAPLAIPACQDVSVTAVDVASVTVSPSQGQLFPGDTLRLTATPRDATGAPLQEHSVSWSSDDVAMASVSSDGLVQAIAAGETRVRARVGNVEGSALMSVRQPPEIVFSESEVRFVGTSSQGSTSSRTVQVTGGGGGTLSRLSVDVKYPSGSAGGWLEATLQGSRTPASLVLRASPATLSPGTYRAEVLVTAEATGTSPRVLPVELTVDAPAPSIRLSSTAVGFAWEAGQSLPPGQSVSITNAGGGSLTGLGTSVRYQGGEPTGWLRVQLSATSAPATLTLGVDPADLSTGVYSAFVEIGSSVAANSPQEIRVRLTVGAPPPQIELSPLSVDWTIAEEQEIPSERLIDLRNLGSGELSGLTASLSYGQGQPAEWLELSLSNSVAPAVVTLTLTTTELLPGGYDATVEVASDEAVNSPQAASVHLTVRPRVAPELSEITADPEAIDADGQSSSLITVLLRDPRGDPMPFGGANVELTSTAGTLGEVVDQQDGTYTALLTAPTVPGVGVVSGTADGVTLGESAAVEFVADSSPVSASLSSVSADPSTGVDADGSDASTVTVVLRDEEDSPVEGLGDGDFSIDLTGNAAHSAVTETATPGTYAFDVTNTTAETVTVTVTAAGVTLDDQPTIEFVADSSPVSASLSSVSADPSTGVDADGSDASTVTVVLRDEEDSPVEGLADDDFSIALTGDASRTAVTETSTSGTYAFDVTNTTAETVTLTVTANGVTLDDQPTIEFVADSGPVSASLSTASAKPDTAVVADGATASTVTLRIRDPDGDFVNGLQDEDFIIGLTGSAQASAVRSRPPPGGYAFDVTDTVAEVVTVTVTVLGVTLDDRPVIEFVAGDVSAEVSSASASPSTSVVADESDASTVTVELRDAHGNPVGGLDDEDFDIDVSGHGEEGPVSESGSTGTYTFEVTNVTAETVAVTIEADNVTLADEPTIEFVAGDVAGENSSASADPSSGLVPDGSDASTVTVELRDANGNPVGGLADDDFSIQLTGDAVRTAVAQTDTVGTYTFDVTNTTAEETTVTITVHGSTVDDQPKVAFDG